jgi:hypothetical protein
MVRALLARYQVLDDKLAMMIDTNYSCWAKPNGSCLVTFGLMSGH